MQVTRAGCVSAQPSSQTSSNVFHLDSALITNFILLSVSVSVSLYLLVSITDTELLNIPGSIDER